MKFVADPAVSWELMEQQSHTRADTRSSEAGPLSTPAGVSQPRARAASRRSSFCAAPAPACPPAGGSATHKYPGAPPNRSRWSGALGGGSAAQMQTARAARVTHARTLSHAHVSSQAFFPQLPKEQICGGVVWRGSLQPGKKLKYPAPETSSFKS